MKDKSYLRKLMIAQSLVIAFLVFTSIHSFVMGMAIFGVVNLILAGANGLILYFNIDSYRNILRTEREEKERIERN